MNSLKFTILLFLTLALAPAVIAQGNCPAIVQQALDAANELCTSTGRNQACYGHIAIDAVPQPGIAALDFDSAGDIEDVTAIQTLRLHPMDAVSQTWGVALMRLQANLPGSLPGQNVTFLLFGDVEITNTVPAEGSEEFTPMQAFLLRTGLGDAQCADAPESGLVVQTPEGVGEVTFNINGVEVGMGSTVVFRAQADGEMTVSTIEGLAVLEVEDEVQPVPAGTRLRVPMDRALRPFRRLIHRPEPYELRNLEGIPLRLLQRRINVAPPLTASQVSEIMRRLNAGEPLCGEAPLPSCDRVPKELLARALKATRARLEDRLNCVFRRGAMPPNETRPFCDTLPPESLPCVFLPGPNDPPLSETETRPYCPQLPEDWRRSNRRSGGSRRGG